MCGVFSLILDIDSDTSDIFFFQFSYFAIEIKPSMLHSLNAAQGFGVFFVFFFELHAMGTIAVYG